MPYNKPSHFCNSESRYLLFLTDNYSSLQILKHYIMSSYSKSNESHYEPFVLFGSSFPKDRDFAQVEQQFHS